MEMFRWGFWPLFAIFFSLSLSLSLFLSFFHSFFLTVYRFLFLFVFLFLSNSCTNIHKPRHTLMPQPLSTYFTLSLSLSFFYLMPNFSFSPSLSLSSIQIYFLTPNYSVTHYFYLSLSLFNTQTQKRTQLLAIFNIISLFLPSHRKRNDFIWRVAVSYHLRLNFSIQGSTQQAKS